MGLYKPTVTRPLPDGASIIERNGQRFARLPADESGKRREVRVSKNGRAYLDKAGLWWGSFRHPVTDELERVPLGTADKTAAGTLLDDARRRAALEKAGLTNPHEKHHKRELAEHLAEWERSMLSSGCTAEYAKKTAYRARVVFDGCECKNWPDIEGTRIKDFIADLRDTAGRRPGDVAPPISLQTRNYYLAACKSFCNWMTKSRRAPFSPIADLAGWDAATDRKHERRALDADELKRLIDSTEAGPVRKGMTGEGRALLYRLAVSTGLRAKELKTLKWRYVDLDADEPSVTVIAAYAKNGKTDTLPLKPDVAQSLTAWRDQQADAYPDSPVFPVMPRDHFIAQMFRADLNAARQAWLSEAGTDGERTKRERSDFLAYQDGAGRFADFHALRHSFISGLATGGVHPKTAQRLARHSTIKLTMDRYTHVVHGAERAAIDTLPDLGRKPQAEPQRKTGTNDADALPESCCTIVVRRDASKAYLGASRGIEGPKLASGKKAGKVGTNSDFPDENRDLSQAGKKSPQGKSNPCQSSKCIGENADFPTCCTSVVPASPTDPPDLAALIAGLRAAWPGMTARERAIFAAMVGVERTPNKS